MDTEQLPTQTPATAMAMDMVRAAPVDMEQLGTQTAATGIMDTNQVHTWRPDTVTGMGHARP
jgi:hypothetical protein